MKALKITGIVLGIIYLAFLALPLGLSFVLNSHSAQIAKMIEDQSGFKVKLGKMRLVTTPKLTAGFKVKHAEIALPTGETFLKADNFQLKLSLLPILARKIRIDVVSAENINLILKVQPDGKFAIESAIPAPQPNAAAPQPLPLGIKLSNHLPDMRVKNYNVSFVDEAGTYTISGSKAAVTNFILNKKIKVAADGKFTLKGRTQFNYDIKILNKIMPDADLNELVFEPAPAPTAQQQPINIIEIFEAIYNNKITTNVKTDLKILGTADEPILHGTSDQTNISIAGTPPGSSKTKFAGDKISMDAKLYTAPNEITTLLGEFKTGKKPYVDLTCKSNATVGSVITILKTVAKSFGIHDLDTLDASGTTDIDFRVKSDMKKLSSAGRANLNSAWLKYGLYGVEVDDINAKISLDNDKIDIKQAGLTIADYPLKISGTINASANTDLKIIGEKLQIKGLLAAAGQAALLKENDFRSGDLSMNISVKGKLDKLEPKAKIVVNSLDVRNIPTDVTVVLPKTDIEGDINGGVVQMQQLKIINPSVNISAPTAKVTIKNSDITINATPVDVDILKEKGLTVNSDIKLDKDALKLSTTGLFAGGKTLASISGSVANLSKIPSMNITVSTPKELEMLIPGFAKSKMLVKINLKLTGTTPNIKGDIRIPVISIPEADTQIDNMLISLTDFAGKGSMSKLKSGGIVAQNLSSDFNIKGTTLYLNTITGDAFNGKIKGSVSYGLTDGKIGVEMAGDGMDAEKAVEGAAGIKNALSGKLGWNASVTLKGVTYEEQMKTLKGNVGFNIDNGTFGNIGRFETMLGAENILNNVVMRTALSGITAIPALKKTAEFKNITGSMNFADGWANLQPIKTSGPAMSYYITGKYNLLNGTANLVILGRLSAQTVALLGPIGDLSVDKLTSYLPKFGELTAAVIQTMTTDPKAENISAIPALSDGNPKYKDFKVVFNGGVESTSSVKSFKWLSNVDTSGLNGLNLKEQVQTSKENLMQLKDTGVKQIQDAKEQVQQLKNMFKI